MVRNGYRLSPVKGCTDGRLCLSPRRKPYGTLYVGSTIDLTRRVYEHKEKAIPGLTAKYGVDKLVWFEEQDTITTARYRERQIKEWKRDGKSL
jgi:putative endonuclease